MTNVPSLFYYRTPNLPYLFYFCLALDFAFHLHHFITQSFAYPASHGIERFGLKF